ncbi:MAG: FecR domain-containing protein [Planctomycetota bacterium]
MNPEQLDQWIEAWLEGSLDDSDHESLQRELKTNPQARARFHHAMELESALRTWASEEPNQSAAPTMNERATTKPADVALGSKLQPSGSRPWMLWVAASLLAMFSGIWFYNLPLDQSDLAEVESNDRFGVVYQETNCVWQLGDREDGISFGQEALTLLEGAAELKFHSGTSLIMQGPCTLLVVNASSAKVGQGNVVVNVGELSDGFELVTPEATIVDQGTEYAVSVDEETTEVHVFEGEVIWKPNSAATEPSDSTDASEPSERVINDGTAVKFARNAPWRPRMIPFGRQQFIRRLRLRRGPFRATHQIIAAEDFDGDDDVPSESIDQNSSTSRFANPRGWATDWVSFGDVSRGEVVGQADEESVDDDNALWKLDGAVDVRRMFHRPVAVNPNGDLVVAMRVRRVNAAPSRFGFMRIAMVPDRPFTQTAGRTQVAFGLTGRGFPFAKVAESIVDAGPPLQDETYIVMMRLKYQVIQQQATIQIRYYRDDETVDTSLPTTWTISETFDGELPVFRGIRVTTGRTAEYEIDDIVIGNQWQIVAAGFVE